MRRRKIPSERQIKTRKAILDSYKDLCPIESAFYGFELGNKKTGKENNLGEKVLIWNLPPVVTCPGAQLCLDYCYNADTRVDVFPVEKWCINWYWAINKEEECFEKICSVLAQYTAPVVRVHSSGDFFSLEYTEMWYKIAKQSAHAKFWCYTRSWRDQSLKEAIMKLSKLENFQVIASVDEGESPPTDLRYCIVGELEKSESLFNCTEQYIDGNQCIECRECFADTKSNIYFVKH